MTWETIAASVFIAFGVGLLIRGGVIMRRVPRTQEYRDLRFVAYAGASVVASFVVGGIDEFPAVKTTPIRWVVLAVQGILLVVSFWCLKQAKRSAPAA